MNAHPEWLLRPPGERPDDLPERAADGRKRWPDPRLRYLDPTGGADWEGIYADPSLPEVRERTVRVFEDIVRRYEVDGFNHGYVRYPKAAYASSPNDHRHVTALVEESARRLRAARPGAVISADRFPDPSVARARASCSAGRIGPSAASSTSSA